MSEHLQRLPFAQRHSSTINLVVAIGLILCSLLLAFVTKAPSVCVPVLVLGLSTLRQAQGHEPIAVELADALRAWAARK